VAVSTITVEDVTVLVGIVNIADVKPAPIVTLTGAVAAEVLLLEILTTAPPEGAGPLNATVPWDGPPLTTVAGLRTKLDTIGGITVSEVDRLTVPHAAVMLGVARAATGLVLTANVALDNPAGIVNKAGTVAADVVSDVRLTPAPPVGAAAFSVTVP